MQNIKPLRDEKKVDDLFKVWMHLLIRLYSRKTSYSVFVLVFNKFSNLLKHLSENNYLTVCTFLFRLKFSSIGVKFVLVFIHSLSSRISCFNSFSSFWGLVHVIFPTKVIHVFISFPFLCGFLISHIRIFVFCLHNYCCKAINSQMCLITL